MLVFFEVTVTTVFPPQVTVTGNVPRGRARLERILLQVSSSFVLSSFRAFALGVGLMLSYLFFLSRATRRIVRLHRTVDSTASVAAAFPINCAIRRIVMQPLSALLLHASSPCFPNEAQPNVRARMHGLILDIPDGLSNIIAQRVKAPPTFKKKFPIPSVPSMHGSACTFNKGGKP